MREAAVLQSALGDLRYFVLSSYLLKIASLLLLSIFIYTSVFPYSKALFIREMRPTPSHNISLSGRYNRIHGKRSIKIFFLMSTGFTDECSFSRLINPITNQGYGVYAAFFIFCLEAFLQM